MTRVVNVGNPSTERKRCLQLISYSIRELSQTTAMSEKARDLTAYIVLALLEIDTSIEKSVAAWEKRGYWVKADKFRSEWTWARKLSDELRIALLSNNWDLIVQLVIRISQKLGAQKLAQRNNFGEIWLGAWNRINK